MTFQNLHLLRELVSRDFNARFAGSAFGVAWAVLQPLSFVCLYWFVFSFMIPRGPGVAGDEYIYYLISGLVPWLGINDGVTRSVTSIVENSSIVRRLPLRSELLVITPNVSTLIFECIGLAVFMPFVIARGGSLRLLWVLPIAVAIQFALQVGVGLFLAAIFVFFRDLSQFIGFALSIVFYLSPILYSAKGRFETFFAWNPLTALLGLFRSAVLSSPLPEARSIVFLLVVAIVLPGSGLLFFRRTRATFVDLI
ncbi:MAG TPA: ABC transporter permease [Thermoanaerobaculia bacterium]|nr:ABC transporter permease [Thermoanaerobaculia bacterium]